MAKAASTKAKPTTTKSTKAPKLEKPPKLSTVLITQPRPETEKSPYFDLAKKFNLKVDFHAFIRVEGIRGNDFRKQRVDINEYTAVVFPSRNAVDHFFRICEEMKYKVNQDMKYFCMTEAVALYLQKFILYRKRKVFFSADGSTAGLMDVIGKHKVELYLLPVSDSGKEDIKNFLNKYKIVYKEMMLYKTVSNDITPIVTSNYDMIVFFSPFSVSTLIESRPDYKQNGTVIGAFGPTTSKAVEDNGLRLDVQAPSPSSPSMAKALEQYLERVQ